MMRVVRIPPGNVKHLKAGQVYEVYHSFQAEHVDPRETLSPDFWGVGRIMGFDNSWGLKEALNGQHVIRDEVLMNWFFRNPECAQRDDLRADDISQWEFRLAGDPALYVDLEITHAGRAWVEGSCPAKKAWPFSMWGPR